MIPRRLTQSLLLTRIPDLVHGFTGRSEGDMKGDAGSRRRVLSALGMGDRILVLPEQVHGCTVIRYHKTLPLPISGADGVVAGPDSSHVVLGVLAADCCMILAVDLVHRVIAAAHGGWKGAAGSIAQSLVMEMRSAGADTTGIRVAIGPYIHPCCYHIPEERVRYFSRYGGDDRVIGCRGGRATLDIGQVHVLDFIESGVPARQIDVSPVCTSCRSDRYYSFRKHAIRPIPEQMGIIAVRKTIVP